MSISPGDSVMEGKQATLSCESDADPPVSEYIWFDSSNRDLHFSGQKLRLEPLKVQHTGSYRCQGSNRLGKDVSPPSTLTVYCKFPSSLSSLLCPGGYRPLPPPLLCPAQPRHTLRPTSSSWLEGHPVLLHRAGFLVPSRGLPCRSSGRSLSLCCLPLLLPSIYASPP